MAVCRSCGRPVARDEAVCTACGMPYPALPATATCTGQLGKAIAAVGVPGVLLAAIVALLRGCGLGG